MIISLYDVFKYWSEEGSVWLIGDTHFGDPDCKLMDPDWPDPKEAVKKINRCVKKRDTIVILGDVGDPEYVKRIRAAHKVLILGNHDRRGECRPYFDEIYYGPVFISDKILLSHEPVHGLPFCLNIHGHDHNQAQADRYQDGGHYLNVASNVCDYTPYNLGTLIREGALSDIKTIHRIAIDEAIKKKDDGIIKEGGPLPNICGLPEDAVAVKIDFENCEQATIPAEMVEDIHICENTEMSVKCDGQTIKWNACRGAFLLRLKPEADMPGSTCGLYGDYSLFSRVCMCPDICAVAIAYENGEETGYSLPWDEEDEYANRNQITEVMGSHLYVSIVHPDWQPNVEEEL